MYVFGGRTTGVCRCLALQSLAITTGILLGNASISSAVVTDSCISGSCEACHAQPQSPGSGSGTFMLRGSDAGSTCLICHEAPNSASQPQGHYVATSSAALAASLAPGQLPSAGDFGWLKRTYNWQGEDLKMECSPGERHGHNIVALNFNYRADTTLHVAPGGAYPANSLSCISCHDPHGNYRRSADGTISATGLPIAASGSYSTSPDPDAFWSVRSYRMLAGREYQPKSLPAATPFTADPPAAVAPPNYNRPESVNDTRVAYGSGMSEWCRNCHALIHNDGVKGLGHPVGNGAKLTSRVMVAYNAYLKSGDLTGASTGSYSSLVPYEMGTADYALLKTTANSDGSNLKGPDMEHGIPNVMCLTCHRAHASGWDSMTRWNTGATLLVLGGRYPGSDNGASALHAQGRTEAETRKTFYDRPASRYAGHQRGLCNKCHAQD